MKKIKIKPQGKKVIGREFNAVEFFNLYRSKITNLAILLLVVIAGLYVIWMWRENKKTEAPVLISQASALFSSGKYEPSLDIYKQFVKEFPKHSLAPSALLGMAYCYEELGNISEAKKVFSDVKARFPNSPWTEDAVKGIERLE